MEEKTEQVIEVQNEANKDENKWCVYCHTNKINGKKYFGITSRPVKDRWRNGNGYDKTQVYFWNAITKYTWDGFEHEIILDCLTETEAKEKEIELIALYKTNCRRYNNPTYGYNCTDGGDGTSGHEVTEETRQKISEAVINNYRQTGRKPWNYGIPMSEEQKEQVRQAHIGKPLSEEHRKKLSDAKKGKIPSNLSMLLSDESIRKKISESLRGHATSDELKEKLSKLKKGKYMGIDSSRFRPIYSIELNEIFWGAKAVNIKYGFNPSNIGLCCRGERNYAYRHPITNEPLHWLYAEDAITQGYITQDNLDCYLNDLKQKGNDEYGTMEKE